MHFLEKLRARSNNILWLMAALYFVGIIGLSWLGHIPAVWYATGPFLLMNGFVLWFFYENARVKDILPLAFAYFAGFGTEVLGTQTGWPFGSYIYGDVLGPALWNTPLLIGFNWLMLTYLVWSWLLGLGFSRHWAVPVGALVLVAYDWVLEPVAIYAGMWTWSGGKPPLQNYLGWFGLAVIILAFYNLTGFHPRNRMASWILLFQWVFFASLRLVIA
ncbi:MAG: carotenoid biosynthesis protein [Bacteroidales bacterium]